MYFGKLTQEEEPLTIFHNNSKIYLQEWLLLIHKKDQRYKKLHLINGLKVQFVHMAKLNNNSVLDNKN